MSPTLDDFKRDPNSPTDLRPCASAELVDTYKEFTKYSDKLVSFAADPSDTGVTLIRRFYETNAIQVTPKLGVADVLGYEGLPV